MSLPSSRFQLTLSKPRSLTSAPWEVSLRGVPVDGLAFEYSSCQELYPVSSRPATRTSLARMYVGPERYSVPKNDEVVLTNVMIDVPLYKRAVCVSRAVVSLLVLLR